MAIKNREIANDWNMVRIVIPLLLTPALWPFDNNVSTSELMKQRNLFHEKLFNPIMLIAHIGKSEFQLLPFHQLHVRISA